MTDLKTADWRNLFERVNQDCDPEERRPLVPANAEFYAQQIWNMTDEGGLPETECNRIAAAICKGD